MAVVARSAAEVAETVQLIERADGRALALTADLTDASLVRRTFTEIERALGPVEVLVNNVGTLGPLGPFSQTEVAQWWQAFEVLVRSPVLCTRMVLPSMIAAGRGRIITVASGAGVMAIPHFSSYNTAKTAVIRFTECVAAEARPYGVALFAIGPGTVRTVMSERALNSPEGRQWLPWFSRIFDAGLDVPPERPAQLVVALASGRADALSGRFLRVSDDLDVVLARVAEVERDKLYSLRVQSLPAGAVDPTLGSILEAAERPGPADPGGAAGQRRR